MLNRPSKALMAWIVGAVGALVAVLTKPFVSHDVGYAQVVPGPKSRKVRHLMLNRPFKTVIARAAIFALVLALAIPFVSGGLTPTASAQTDSLKRVLRMTTEFLCRVNSTTMRTARTPWPTSARWTPRVQGDRLGSSRGPTPADFDITGGVLTFKKSPNFEMPGRR